MSEAGTERKPIAEMTILLIGSILTAVAIHLESDVLLIPSIFTCIFAGIAETTVYLRIAAVNALFTLLAILAIAFILRTVGALSGKNRRK